MPSLRDLVAFLVGFVLGALALLLALQSRDRLKTSSGVESPPETFARGELPQIVARELPRGPSLPIEPNGIPRPGSSPQPSPGIRSGPAASTAELPGRTTNDDALIALPVVGVKKSELRDHFNDRRGGARTHLAIDIMAARGTPVVAAVDGRVQKLFLSNAGGITIYQSDPSETLMYYYAHLESYAPSLAEGQFVRRGQIIGFVGSTGNANPSGPHLHFSVARLPPTKEWWKGDPINPYPLLMQRGMETVAVKR